MFLGNMKPDQRYPEMLANCKCDAGFYMVASGVYGGRCEECMENACSPVGSISEDQCSCLPGAFLRHSAAFASSVCAEHSAREFMLWPPNIQRWSDQLTCRALTGARKDKTLD